VDPIRCEGCKVCVHFCPESAIEFFPCDCGQWSIDRTRFGPLVHAQLFPGEENSGKLVALLRQEAKKLADTEEKSLILSDGPPGIGCPVISAASGQDLAVLVTEPTPSGLHDLGRVVELCRHFRLPAAVVINKTDLNEKGSRRIRTFCRDNGISVVGELPYDPDFVNAMVAGLALTEYTDGTTAEKLHSTWQRILERVALRAAA
jgi:MinD superfamily P-loop ATPase